MLVQKLHLVMRSFGLGRKTKIGRTRYGLENSPHSRPALAKLFGQVMEFRPTVLHYGYLAIAQSSNSQSVRWGQEELGGCVTVHPAETPVLAKKLLGRSTRARRVGRPYAEPGMILKGEKWDDSLVFVRALFVAETAAMKPTWLTRFTKDAPHMEVEGGRLGP